MSDTRFAQDDAPLTTSKDQDVLDQAAEAVGGEAGDTVSGRTATVNRPRAELYAFWRDFANLPRFMDGLEQVLVQDSTRSRWAMRAPDGKAAEWDVLITGEADGSFIAWSSAEGAEIKMHGRVDFKDATGGRGTTVTLTIAYDQPGGTIGKFIATILQRDPGLVARRDLRRFKQLMETGEIAVSAWTNAQAQAADKE